MSGKETQRFNLYLLIAILLVFCGHDLCTAKNVMLIEQRAEELLPYVSPTGSPMPFLPPSPTASPMPFLPPSPTASPMPFLPLLAPSPLTPFTNSTIPKLSGLCPLNFTALQNLMMVTSTDCLGSFAPLLANVVCCPQLEATLIILVGQSSKQTNTLSLNQTLAHHCLSDFEQILVGQGANDSLPKICSIHSSNLTEGSCPIADVAEFESTVDSSNLLAACEKIDSVNECCKQVCENAILDASRKLAEKAYDLMSLDSSHVLSDHSTRVNDCKSVVVRWLGSKLEPLRAKDVFRGLSNCKINKVCPLTFPNTSHIIQGCGVTSNQSTCCSAVESYVTHLQRQSFVTNLQALNCATSLGVKLRKANITQNVYSQCHISLKDFSLQVGAQESGGCLLPSLPSDVVFDISAGVSFRCDLNDNIPAPWPATSEFPASSCNKSVKLPALPAAASGQSSLQSTYTDSIALLMFLAMLLILMLQ